MTVSDIRTGEVLVRLTGADLLEMGVKQVQVLVGRRGERGRAKAGADEACANTRDVAHGAGAGDCAEERG